jgi:hypothetical protein
VLTLLPTLWAVFVYLYLFTVPPTKYAIGNAAALPAMTKTCVGCCFPLCLCLRLCASQLWVYSLTAKLIHALLHGLAGLALQPSCTFQLCINDDALNPCELHAAEGLAACSYSISCDSISCCGWWALACVH